MAKTPQNNELLKALKANAEVPKQIATAIKESLKTLIAGVGKDGKPAKALNADDIADAISKKDEARETKREREGAGAARLRTTLGIGAAGVGVSALGRTAQALAAPLETRAEKGEKLTRGLAATTAGAVPAALDPLIGTALATQLSNAVSGAVDSILGASQFKAATVREGIKGGFAGLEELAGFGIGIPEETIISQENILRKQQERKFEFRERRTDVIAGAEAAEEFRFLARQGIGSAEQDAGFTTEEARLRKLARIVAPRRTFFGSSEAEIEAVQRALSLMLERLNNIDSAERVAVGGS